MALGSQHLITIERHILDHQRDFPGVTGAFTGLLYDIALAAKIISRETTRAGLVTSWGRRVAPTSTARPSKSWTSSRTV